MCSYLPSTVLNRTNEKNHKRGHSSFVQKIAFLISGFPVTCRAPNTTIVVGAQGSAAAADIQKLANACNTNNYGGIMVWFGSVANGFTYEATWDTANYPASAQAFTDALNSFQAFNG